MLTQNTTKTTRRTPTGTQLARPLPRRSLQTVVIDRAACALNFRYWLRDVLLAEKTYDLYRASDLLFGRDCCVKMLSSSFKDKKTGEQQLLHEADVLPRLVHPNIAELYECSWDDEKTLFSVMEPLQGRDLHELLAETSALPLERTLEILHGVGAALQHTHDHGFVHMNINPHSVFLHQPPSDTASAAEVVKVLHFGLARPLATHKRDPLRNLLLDLVFDAPAYLAPEALELGSTTVDDRADQWSLAVLAYQMLSGQLPFYDAEPWSLRALIRGQAAPVPLAELVPQLPAHVSAAITRALCKDKHQRFGSVTDFLSALDNMPVLTSRRTQPELHEELIACCRAGVPTPVAVPTVRPTDKKTREYPAPSFPAELLAAADRESVSWPAPRLAPPWTGEMVRSRRWGAGPQLWLVACIVMALIPAGVAFYFLHPGSPLSTLLFHRAPQSAPPPAGVASAPPGTVASAHRAPSGSATARATAHSHKSAHAYRGRTRAAKKSALASLGQDAYRTKSSAKSAQDALAAGLGL